MLGLSESTDTLKELGASNVQLAAQFTLVPVWATNLSSHFNVKMFFNHYKLPTYLVVKQNVYIINCFSSFNPYSDKYNQSKNVQAIFACLIPYHSYLTIIKCYAKK